MAAEGDASLKRKNEGEFPEQTINVGKLVKTLILSFLRSESNYGAITDIKSDVKKIYSIVMQYIDEEKLDVYALKLDDRILLSKTSMDFDDVYEVIKTRSQLQIKKDMIEIWDDPDSRILHLIVVPVKKHFPMDYASTRQRAKMIEDISSMTWAISSP